MLHEKFSVQLKPLAKRQIEDFMSLDDFYSQTFDGYAVKYPQAAYFGLIISKKEPIQLLIEVSYKQLIIHEVAKATIPKINYLQIRVQFSQTEALIPGEFLHNLSKITITDMEVLEQVAAWQQYYTFQMEQKQQKAAIIQAKYENTTCMVTLDQTFICDRIGESLFVDFGYKKALFGTVVAQLNDRTIQVEMATSFKENDRLLLKGLHLFIYDEMKTKQLIMTHQYLTKVYKKLQKKPIISHPFFNTLYCDTTKFILKDDVPTLDTLLTIHPKIAIIENKDEPPVIEYGSNIKVSEDKEQRVFIEEMDRYFEEHQTIQKQTIHLIADEKMEKIVEKAIKENEDKIKKEQQYIENSNGVSSILIENRLTLQKDIERLQQDIEKSYTAQKDNETEISYFEKSIKTLKQQFDDAKQQVTTYENQVTLREAELADGEAQFALYTSEIDRYTDAIKQHKKLFQFQEIQLANDHVVSDIKKDIDIYIKTHQELQKAFNDMDDFGNYEELKSLLEIIQKGSKLVDVHLQSSFVGHYLALTKTYLDQFEALQTSEELVSNALQQTAAIYEEVGVEKEQGEAAFYDEKEYEYVVSDTLQELQKKPKLVLFQKKQYKEWQQTMKMYVEELIRQKNKIDFEMQLVNQKLEEQAQYRDQLKETLSIDYLAVQSQLQIKMTMIEEELNFHEVIRTHIDTDECSAQQQLKQLSIETAGRSDAFRVFEDIERVKLKQKEKLLYKAQLRDRTIHLNTLFEQEVVHLQQAVENAEQEAVTRIQQLNDSTNNYDEQIIQLKQTIAEKENKQAHIDEQMSFLASQRLLNEQTIQKHEKRLETIRLACEERKEQLPQFEHKRQLLEKWQQVYAALPLIEKQRFLHEQFQVQIYEDRAVLPQAQNVVVQKAYNWIELLALYEQQKFLFVQPIKTTIIQEKDVQTFSDSLLAKGIHIDNCRRFTKYLLQKPFDYLINVEKKERVLNEHV